MKLAEVEHYALEKISEISQRTHPEFVPPNPHPEDVVASRRLNGGIIGGVIGAICGVLFEASLEWHKVAENTNLFLWLGDFLIGYVTTNS